MQRGKGCGWSGPGRLLGAGGRQEGAGSYPLPHMAILPLPVDISRGTFVITEQKPGEPLHLKLIKQKGGKERGSYQIN